jgi:N-methylhydantoinase B
MTLSKHINEEGVRLEPTLLIAGGQRVEQILRRLRDAARTPDERLGDLDAQLGAIDVGESAIRRIIERRGARLFHAAGAELIEYSRSTLRRAIAQIPDGIYSFEDVMDDDGAGNGPVHIRANVRIDQDRATVDLSASDDQVPGCINCPVAVTRSAVYYCFASLLEECVPLNAGVFVDVKTRPGSVVHAAYPAAVVAGNTETSQRIVDVVLGALAQAMPGRIPAASCGTMSSVALGGAGWTYYETIGGGCGAGPTWDGEHAIQCHMTNTLNTPAEAIEMQYPLRVRRFERAPGTGGIGRFTGGDGIVRELEALAPCEGTILSDRRTSQPYGLDGATPGSNGMNTVLSGPQSQELYGKARFTLAPGDRIRVVTPGGGGWGCAPDRP